MNEKIKKEGINEAYKLHRILNIGCGEGPLEGCINIDDGSDNEDILKTKGVLMMDGNNMDFGNELFEEVRSNQCVGIYVTNYDEILRVLKKEGRIVIGIWGEKLGELIYELIRRNVRITKVDLLNGSFDDDIDEVTFEVEGIKE